MHTGIPSPDPSWAQWSVGPLTLHTYALCILLGIAAAVLIASRRLTARGGPEGAVLDIATWAVPSGIVGARIYHVLTHWGDYVGPGLDPVRVLYVWEGGIAILGSLIGGALGAWVGCRRAGVRLASFADALAPGMLVAQAVGRLGNWFNHELYGGPTTLPWGLQIPSTNPAFPDDLPDGTLFHPLFLYEGLWNLLGVVVLLQLERRFRLRWGRVFGLYLVWYGAGRVWLELLRIDPTSVTPLGLPANVWGALLAALLGATVVVVQGRRHPEPETSVLLPGREPRGLRDGDAGDAGAVAAGDVPVGDVPVDDVPVGDGPVGDAGGNDRNPPAAAPPS